MPLPELPSTELPQGGPAPVESLPAPNATGAAFEAGLGHTLGVSLEGKVVGKLRGTFGTAEQRAFVSYDDAKAEMESDGYDSHVLPKAGLTRGELDTIISQQSRIRQDEAIVAQSRNPDGWKVQAAGIGGSSLDPLFLGLGPVLGRFALGAKGLALGGRLAAGGLEGAATMGAYDTGLRQYGTAPGDHDINTQRVVGDMVVGGVLGAVTHGAFGERAPAPRDTEAQLGMIERLENSAGYAKAHGIPVNEVTSNKGAIGVYQLTPAVAKQHGFDPAMLKDPAYAKQVAEAHMKWLDKRYGGDPEAIAVAWNAGAGTADKWLKAGRDLKVLPKETQAYVLRVGGEAPRTAFGLQETPPPSHISMDWTQLEPDDYPSAFAHAAQADAVDAKPDIASVVRAPAPEDEAAPVRPGAIFSDDDARSAEQSHAPQTPEQNPQGPAKQPANAVSAEQGELAQHTQAAVQEAKARPSEADTHPAELMIAEAEGALHEEGYSPEMVKAVSAAVRCALVNGID